MKILILCLIFVFSSSAMSGEVLNFKAGLMCGINKDDLGWVCFEQKKIPITGQSSCIANGNIEKCTWYGFSFDYKNFQQSDVISCNYTASKVVKEINMSAVVKESTKHGEFNFTVQGGSGHFINPQYSLLKPNSGSLNTSTVCKIKDKILFRYSFKTISPKV